MITVVTHKSELDALRLTTMAGVKQYRGELVKDHRGRRDIQRVTLPDGTELYLKRIWQAHRKDGLRSLVTRSVVWSICREEFENCRALAAADIGVAAPAAYGEECGPLWERFSFLITRAAAGQTVAQFLRENQLVAERRRTFDALARFIRQLHDAGFATPDLFTRHIFVDSRSDPPRFCLIDMARLDRGRPNRARDLAALNLTAPRRFVSDEERKRFLEMYGEPDLCAAIQRRMHHLARRPKFQDFFKNTEPNVK